MTPVLPESVRVFGVRHHSPRSAAVLSTVLDEHRPDLILVEGPPETMDVLDALTDPETEPPVAILGYRTDGVPCSSLWPFASYSPEYVAVKWARNAGVPVGFIDLPVGVALAETDEGVSEGGVGDVNRAAADARGFRSFEELWESSFEVPNHDPASFSPLMAAYAELVCAASSRPIHRARDAWMAARIRERATERTLVVVGAAHAAAFAAGDVDDAMLAILPAPVPSATTLIPFSFPRLSEQLGYGAGNRAPQYYQRAHEAGCDFRRATLEVLVDFTDHLRLRGFAVSLADTIEAYRLANTLSDIRGKSGPGLDELREAAIATMCRGDAGHVDKILWPTVIGRRIGKVSRRIGKNSLQDEFWQELEHRRLPRADEAERFNLQLNNEMQVGTSVFLHRLRVCGIPYAAFQGTRTVSGFRDKDEAAGGIDALTRVRETWSAQWTPATEIALVEAIVFGDTIEQVATRKLEERLADAVTTGEAADVLLEATVAACPGTVATALVACDRLASVDEDLPSLARACRALSGLSSYGSSRARSDEALVELCSKTFARAVLRVGHASRGDDDAIRPVLAALRSLHDVAVSQPKVDGQAWFSAALGLVEDYGAHPAACGMCCGLLFVAQVIDDDGVGRIVQQRLSDPDDPGKVARFLEGFLEVDARVITRSDPVVQAIDTFLLALDPEVFRDALPVLRRAFGQLGPTERRYLHETLMRVRKIGAAGAEVKAVLDAADKARLAELDTELSSVMDDLEDLF